MARTQVNSVKPGLQNEIINGDFKIWQRGTSFSTPANSSYLADRWRTDYNGTIGAFTISRQSFTLGQTDVPGNPTYFLRWNHTSAGSGSTARVFQQKIEGVSTLAGKSATVTFWAKADSARSIAIRAIQEFGTGGSPSASVQSAATTVDLTTAWQRFDVSIAIPSISGKTLGSNGDDHLSLQFEMPLNVTFTIDIANVMFNEGGPAAAFKLAGETHSGEVTLCQRYYEVARFGLRIDYSNDGAASFESTHHYMALKRKVPSITLFNLATSGISSGPTVSSVSNYYFQIAAVATGSGVPLAHYYFGDAIIDAEI
jgi:hypothetical protein